MRSRWNDTEARACATGLELRAYSSRLLGQDPAPGLAGTAFSRTTGAQLPVDGGNERVV